MKDQEDIVEPLAERILGRVTVNDVVNPLTEEVIIKTGDEITEEIAQEIDDAGIETVEIRSVLTCDSKKGVCAKCYGRNLANGKMVQKAKQLV